MADEEILRGLDVVRMCQLVATTVVLYDHGALRQNSLYSQFTDNSFLVITVGQEVEYIWRKQWSASKTLFILVSTNPLNSPFVLTASRAESLLGGVFVDGYFNILLICIGGAVMSLRVVAMHEGSKKILVFVCALLLGELISMVTVLSLSFKTTTVLSQSSIHSCITTGVPHYYWTFYLFPMVLETVLFGLALSVAFKHIREKGLLTGQSVLDVLFRDSISYFVIIECAFSANAATAFYVTRHDMYKKGILHVPWLQIPQGVSISITVLVVSRLILNLQHVYHLPIRDHSAVESSIQWREPSDEVDLPDVRLYKLNSPPP
ncbi:uncharacterized protein BT62DRAFT_1002986 [Guyanagaster necrorhizus]|uniref:DUF6533 domain-containing protein n=1 Tax=Guyanagaster necrorhizus TaxID=856835 RepID=A0A9P7VZI4_9AGAR|nr:uncharacterized protein BT62DRAFT_1002986 [Guyanagaster necrorhizus MCA 3950]KAG7449412.1 hypothetical protein BT62DRAFT_1002986 [Guyanagaster necrorhizus MCA 3950]